MTTYLNMFVTACVMGTASMLFAADAAPVAGQSAAGQSAPAAVTSDSALSDAAASKDAPLQATIRNVKGIVQYRTGDDQPWQKVEEGQTLDIGVEFRTGPRSSVTFHLPPDQLITLDRLGTLKLLDALNNEDKSRATTELGMRYGRTRYQVEGAQGVEHQATIRSPSATLAIRGTQDVTLTDQRPGLASAISKRTRVYFRPSGSPTQVVFGSNEDSAEQMVVEGDTSPAERRNQDRIVDPGPRHARSNAEFQILNDFELFNGPPLTSQSILGAHVGAAKVPADHPTCGCGDNNEG